MVMVATLVLFDLLCMCDVMLVTSCCERWSAVFVRLGDAMCVQVKRKRHAAWDAPAPSDPFTESNTVTLAAAQEHKTAHP